MRLIPRHPLYDFDKIFGNFYAPESGSEANLGFFNPRVDITDKDEYYEIVADLPGVEKDNLSVTLEDGVLTIEASAQQEKSEEKEGRVICKERCSGSYHRSFNLGHNVQGSDVTASFKNGVLTLHAPNLKKAVPEAKKIDIR